MPTRRTGHRRAKTVQYERDSVEFSRALAFSDATFAIATTLLVTTLWAARKVAESEAAVEA